MRTSSNRVALVGGVFDPLHAGHLRYLEAASKYGRLVCALSDAPDKHPPLVPIAQRVSLLTALGCERVIVHDGTEIPQIIADLKPTSYVKGEDWLGKLPDDQRAACCRVGATIVYTKTAQASSSELLADYQRRLNAEKLADFEVFVATQPSAEPWAPVTDYSRETRRQIEAPQADILAELFAGMSVLDYGCGYGYLVELLKERGMEVHGWDPQRQARSTSVFAPPESYDVVICREVLEHVALSDWPATIAHMRGLADRFIYLTTRFTAKPHLFDVDGSDDLDPTHISMVNQDLLRALFVLHGCRRRPDLEARLDHRQLGRVLVYEVARD